MRSWRRVFSHALGLLLLYQVLRLLFWQQNRLQFPDSDGLLWASFLHGLRFDLSTIAMCNALPYLLYVFPSPQSWQLWQARICFVFTASINSVSLGLNLVDVEYTKFTGKRLTRDSFAIAQDIGEQTGAVLQYYWHYSLILIALILLSTWLSRHCFLSAQRSKRPESRSLLSALLCMLVLGLAGRGGWQHKPLIPANASALGRLGTIALNSTFTLLKSSQKASLKQLHYFSDAELRALLAAPAAGLKAAAMPRPKNVVLVILESFGKEYVSPTSQRPSYAPFLQSLMQRGSNFPLAFANGRRSIDALPAILASIPAWMDAPFITSPYQTNRVRGLAAVLREHAWVSSFYHGGKNGTMFFDVMAQQFGFQRYLGVNEYPHAADSDGQWGIFDEPFLQYVLTDIDKQSQVVKAEEGAGFFATIFTLSSHHPYRIPDRYAGRFPKGTLEIHESIAYADYALQKFYEEAQKKPWFADTLFILTADHTSKSEDPVYETPYGHFAVPLLFIQNNQPLPLDVIQEPVQHADIAPTVLDILDLSSEQSSPFGRSLCRPLGRPGVVLFEAGQLVLLKRQELLLWSPDQAAQGFDWVNDPLLKQTLSSPAEESDLRFLKAQIQAYNNGMVRDQLFW